MVVGINNYVTGLQLTFADETTFELGTFPINPTSYDVVNLLGFTGTTDGDNLLDMQPIQFDESCYGSEEAQAPDE